MEDTIYLGDSREILPLLPDAFFQLIYVDPPFNTGKAQTRRTLRTVPDEQGDRTGFQDRRYRTELLQESSYRDSFDDYLGFLEPLAGEARHDPRLRQGRKALPLRFGGGRSRAVHGPRARHGRESRPRQAPD